MHRSTYLWLPRETAAQQCLPLHTFAEVVSTPAPHLWSASGSATRPCACWPHWLCAMHWSEVSTSPYVFITPLSLSIG
ncbi:hypothetical protein GYMLUDRAFT_50317 [Collybiopsis luxurians FD-317 M1]|uniref:Uncharacterized protein n=1 Tax=Collybiopsis luxurians FD-317 M1 TaxID=944289 RepID=A0A0D0CAE3_9AGAR|nr:hypothetical protein GYMLUDRAFT_50317 [Collybiopsis luxurians FD-317 M1]